MRLLGKKIFKGLHPVIKWMFEWYLSKPRNYSYQSLKIKVLPGVFHPGFFYSTKMFLRFLENINVQRKTVLELGCGSGLISLIMAKRGATVTASDINETAIKNIGINATRNKSTIQIIQSDLFDRLTIDDYQYILINPPYYPISPKNMKEAAWYCGENFEYFAKLFEQLSQADLKNTIIYMILCEGCDLTKINLMALTKGFSLIKLHEEKLHGEWNFIYRIDRS